MIGVTVLMVLAAWVAVSGPAALLVAWVLRAHPPTDALPAPRPSWSGQLTGTSRSSQ